MPVSSKVKPPRSNKPRTKPRSKPRTNNNKKGIKQTGGSDVCNQNLNDLLTGNPLIASNKTVKDVDFKAETASMGDAFKKDVMGSFEGIEKGWGTTPGLPPKLPSDCCIL
jgi:hypothetical protein